MEARITAKNSPHLAIDILVYHTYTYAYAIKQETLPMAVTNVEKALAHLQTAISLLKGADESEPRNPKWFRDTGHLNDKGIDHLNSLFEQGKTTYAAAKEMGISYRATSLRHEQWRKQRAKS
jgi:hypothetical protein